MEDIGIYTEIHESGNKTKGGHKLYFATCKVCGLQVEKKLTDIKRNNKLCKHKSQRRKTQGKNDMPKGWINSSELNRRIYVLWKGMLRRTTEEVWNRYPTYKGTTVDESWKNLSIFVEDIQHLQGYNKWVYSPKRSMMLDKDTLVKGNKHYSKNTCCFISALESSRDVHKRHPNMAGKGGAVVAKKYSIPVEIINIETGEKRTFPSLSSACRIMGWSKGGAYKVVSDKYPHHYSIKGWTIIRKQNDSTQ